MPIPETAREALGSFGLEGAELEPLGTGLINDTYLVTAPRGRFVLQCLNKIFAPEVNLDIDALTRHLEAAGAVTQRLQPVVSGGKLWVEIDGRIWRLATYIAGTCFDRLDNTGQAHAAGQLLGRFHRNISDLEIELHSQRLGVHDTARHVQALRDALSAGRQHRYYEKLAPLAEAILSIADELPELLPLPDRLVHGDPKISNLVFDEDGVGVCMIDLDTLAYMPLPLEMGDAFRSWCNPRGEDQSAPLFRVDLFEAAMLGYASVTRELLEAAEWRAFVPATGIIMVELAARFATDAFNECYFGWDAARFADSSTHNQVRAAGQLALSKSLHEHQAEAEAIVIRAFTDPG
jgi:Ser/Thr protein kinase RdoA (MazF antagonist)